MLSVVSCMFSICGWQFYSEMCTWDSAKGIETDGRVFFTKTHMMWLLHVDWLAGLSLVQAMRPAIALNYFVCAET